MSEMKDVRRCRLDENNRLSLRFGKTMGKGNGGGGEGEKRKEKMEKKKMVSQTSPVTLRHHRPVTPPLPPRLRKTQSCFPSTYVMIISGVVNKRFRKKNMVRTVRRTDRPADGQILIQGENLNGQDSEGTKWQGRMVNGRDGE